MSTPYYTDDRVTLHHGDALEVLRGLPDASVDSVVTDPPYGLGFMGREWDSIKAEASRPQSADEVDERFRNVFPRTGKGPSAVAFDGIAFQQWCEAWAAECLRVLKPGGHMLAFGGTRTWHRLACAVEDAGFEVRDSIAWLYGSGFPKSLDVSKAIDKAAGAEREVVGRKGGRYAYRHNPEMASHAPNGMFRWGDRHYAWTDLPPNARDFFTKAAAEKGNITAPATPDAERWQGWGTALKPAFEPVVVARKPLGGTVASNVLQHGTGALNIDACRVNPGEAVPGGGGLKAGGMLSRAAHAQHGYRDAGDPYPSETGATQPHTAGRWPTNVVLDDSQAAALDEQSGETTSAKPSASGRYGEHQDTGRNETYGKGLSSSTPNRPPIGDSGGASRFFPTFRYEAKAPTTERPRYTRPMLRLRGDLTPAQVDHVRARLTEAGVQVD